MRIRFQTLLLAFSVAATLVSVHAQDDDGYAAQRIASSKYAVQHLTDRDPLVRQRSAEVLAKFSSVEHQRLVEGYRLQEKNDRVRLALDWALYRMGKTESLYGVVSHLRSDSRRPQAVGYLSQLVGPQPLHGFFEGADTKTLIGLLEVMAKIGDADSLELIKPLTDAYDPKVSGLARFVISEITTRLERPAVDTPSRQREVPATSDVSPGTAPFN